MGRLDYFLGTVASIAALELFPESIKKFNNFIEKIRQGYNNINYHNEKHSIDVCI